MQLLPVSVMGHRSRCFIFMQASEDNDRDDALLNVTLVQIKVITVDSSEEILQNRTNMKQAYCVVSTAIKMDQNG